MPPLPPPTPPRRRPAAESPPSGKRAARASVLCLLLSGALAIAPGARAAPASPQGRPETGTTVERRLFLMGTEVAVSVTAGTRSAAVAAGEAAVRELEAAERRLSTWRDDSELARVNRGGAGEVVPVSAELAAELAAAADCRERTDGAFDPAVGPLVSAWNLRGGGREPGPEELARARERVRAADWTVLREPATVRLGAAVELEEGGFGKGAALDAAMARLRSAPGVVAARLDLGGQVALLGTGSVALAHPRDRHRPVIRIALDGGSVATSGNGERGIEVAGRRHGHLLDPRSGRPVEDFGSVAVWAPEALNADCLATGLYVAGPRAARAGRGLPEGVEVVVMESTPTGTPEGLEVTLSPGLAGRLEWAAPEVEIRGVETWEGEAGREESTLSGAAAGRGRDGHGAQRTPALDGKRPAGP